MYRYARCLCPRNHVETFSRSQVRVARYHSLRNVSDPLNASQAPAERVPDNVDGSPWIFDIHGNRKRSALDGIGAQQRWLQVRIAASSDSHGGANIKALYDILLRIESICSDLDPD